MASSIKRLMIAAVVAMVFGACVVSFRGSDLDVNGALTQPQGPVVVTRVYTGSDGESHAEEMVLKMLPGAESTASSEQINVTGMRFRQTPPDYVFQGTAPRRMYVITLSGRAEIELADGKRVPIDRDHIVLLEDLIGKDRVLRGVGAEDRVSIQSPVQE